MLFPYVKMAGNSTHTPQITGQMEKNISGTVNAICASNCTISTVASAVQALAGALVAQGWPAGLAD